MKFIVSSSSLLKRLQKAGGVLSTSNNLPILDDFLFEISGGSLTITASDLETTIITKMDVESKEDGLLAIPAKLLMDILKSFPDHPLTFTIDKDNFGVEISSDYGKYKLAGHDGKEFPKTPSMESPSSITINGMDMANIINKTLFASGNDDLRPVMSGVLFELGTDGVTWVATDAHKLVKLKRADVKSDKGASFIMPKKPLNLLKNILAEVDEDVKLEYNETNAMFQFGESQLICRLIDGKYPNYEAVIPKENPNVLTIERQSFLSSVRRVSIFSSKTTYQVRLKISGSELHLSAEDLDFSNEAKERLTCKYTGNDIEIGFNSQFLIEMLNNLGSDEVNLELSEPNRAGILKPADGGEENEEILMLVMPVMLNA